MFLLDPPPKIGRATADNDALDNVLQGWGVSMEKNLLLDLSPVGQLLGVGPTIALVSNSRSAPHRERNERNRHGISLVAFLDDQEHGQDDGTEAV